MAPICGGLSTFARKQLPKRPHYLVDYRHRRPLVCMDKVLGDGGRSDNPGGHSVSLRYTFMGAACVTHGHLAGPLGEITPSAHTGVHQDLPAAPSSCQSEYYERAQLRARLARNTQSIRATRITSNKVTFIRLIDLANLLPATFK